MSDLKTALESTWGFRIGLGVLLVVGIAVLYLSLHPRSRPPRDDGTQPKLPKAEAPAFSR